MASRFSIYEENSKMYYYYMHLLEMKRVYRELALMIYCLKKIYPYNKLAQRWWEREEQMVLMVMIAIKSAMMMLAILWVIIVAIIFIPVFLLSSLFWYYVQDEKLCWVYTLQQSQKNTFA